MKEYTIDAKNKSFGRVAAEAASVLRGKNIVNFAPYRLPAIKLIIKNTAQIKISGNKLKQKRYIRHSMYPGSLQIAKMEEVIAKKGIKYVLEKAVNGMLPKNKLRKQMMKNLVIE